MPSPLSSPRSPAGLRLAVVPRAALPAAHLDAVAALCERAYEEDLRVTLAAFPRRHARARVDGEAPAPTLVSHLCWVPRTLGYGGPPARWPSDGLAPHDPEAAGAVAVRASYVELVATEPACQGRGYATALLETAAAAIATDSAYALGGLSPSDPAFYARLGWRRGAARDTRPAGRARGAHAGRGRDGAPGCRAPTARSGRSTSTGRSRRRGGRARSVGRPFQDSGGPASERHADPARGRVLGRRVGPFGPVPEPSRSRSSGSTRVAFGRPPTRAR
jgi:GNAT superfamily N-acetyltransferase